MDREVLSLWACNAPSLLYRAARRAALWGEWAYSQRVAAFGDVAVVGSDPLTFVTADGRFWFASSAEEAIEEWLATPVRRPGWLLPVVSYMPHHDWVHGCVSSIVAVATEAGGDVFGALRGDGCHIFGARDRDWAVVGRVDGEASWWSSVPIAEEGDSALREIILDMLS